jgi:hypothetical protein
MFSLFGCVYGIGRTFKPGLCVRHETYEVVVQWLQLHCGLRPYYNPSTSTIISVNGLKSTVRSAENGLV